MKRIDALLRDAFSEAVFRRPRSDCPMGKESCKFWNEVFGLCSAKEPPDGTPCMEAAAQFQKENAK